MNDFELGLHARPLLLASALVFTVLLLGCDRAGEERAAESASQAVRSANQALKKAEAVAREGAREAGQFARKLGEVAEEGAEASVRALSDGGLTARVKTALLADDAVAGEKIDVDSDDGVVTLTGRLPNQTQIERALTIARAIEGVERVESRLTVESAG